MSARRLRIELQDLYQVSTKRDKELCFYETDLSTERKLIPKKARLLKIKVHPALPLCLERKAGFLHFTRLSFPCKFILFLSVTNRNTR